MPTTPWFPMNECHCPEDMRDGGVCCGYCGGDSGCDCLYKEDADVLEFMNQESPKGEK